MSSFLRQKLSRATFRELIHSQLDPLVVSLVGWIPTIAGFVLRNLAYRACGMRAGGFFWIQPRVTLVNLHQLRVGRNFGCNSGTYINAIGGIKCGDNVLIGANVTISSGKHEIDRLASPIFQSPVVPMPITIESDVWIGAGASILPNVRIAEGTVVGANCVVTRDTQPYSVVVGIPGKITRFRIK